MFWGGIWARETGSGVQGKARSKVTLQQRPGGGSERAWQLLEEGPRNRERPLRRLQEARESRRERTQREGEAAGAEEQIEDGERTWQEAR